MTKVLAFFIYLFSRLLSSTFRVSYHGMEHLETAQRGGQSGRYIYALWHQNLLMALSSHQHETCAMIVSASKDGEIVATACQRYGHFPVRGSSHRGALRALVSMANAMKSGDYNGAITVDGPKGPCHQVKRGIIDIAKKSQSWIVPLSTYPEKYWEFESWDRFRLPKPFSRIIVQYSQPIPIPTELALENYEAICQEIKQKLVNGEQEAKNHLKPLP